jgi:hypothetical protein
VGAFSATYYKFMNAQPFVELGNSLVPCQQGTRVRYSNAGLKCRRLAGNLMVGVTGDETVEERASRNHLTRQGACS